MFKHLLVPLDGSAMAEAALPVAATLAEKAGGDVTLLHVLESRPPRSVHGQRHLAGRQEAEDYLRQTAQRAFPAAAPACWHVHEQPVRRLAGSLADHVEEFDQDLVIMCAHGPKRLRDRFLGNLAQQLARRRAVPILLLRVRKTAPPHFPFQRMLVCLDAKPSHEDALTVAADLAKLCGSSMLLLTAVPTPGTLTGKDAAAGALLPGAMQQVLNLRQEQAVEYLDQRVQRLRKEGLEASGRVARGKVADLIEQAATDIGADLVAVGTHGATGLDALWFGGIPRRLFRRIDSSFLLIPIRD